MKETGRFSKKREEYPWQRYKISFGEQQLISLDRLSKHDHFASCRGEYIGARKEQMHGMTMQVQHFFSLIQCTFEVRTVIKTCYGRSGILTLFQNR